MDNTAVRAARVMNSQTAMLRRRMEASKPQPQEENGLLFKRAVQVPPNTDIQKLLQKWNPGMPESTIVDMVGSVCRWNRLPGPEAVQEGQQLLIPTVIPHGQTPNTMQRTGAQPLRVAPPAPVRSQASLTSQMAEQKARTVAQNPGGGASTIWATKESNQNLAGAKVKQQFQANIWARG